LRALGHDVVAVDLPCDDDNAGLDVYAQCVVEAVGPRQDVILVAQSLGGFTAPLLCDRLPVSLMVLVNAMVPVPGESAGEWWANTGHVFPDPFDPAEVFVHDVPADVAAEQETHLRAQSGTPFEKPWPLGAWPDVPTRVLLCRDDRFFPADFQRRVAKDRLGIIPDEMPGGHLPALAHPDELVEWLERYRTETGGLSAPS
jgi:pimeloyl-ACP methyl ester carboxylesterase